MDVGLAEQLLEESDVDSMDDAMYIKMHVVMEALEQLNDHNDVAVEYPLYDNLKKYGLEVSLEDQAVNTFSPIQVYLAPFDCRILCPYMNARLSAVDYCFPDVQRRLFSCLFIPDANRVEQPNMSQRSYIANVLSTTGEALPSDFISRQPSAHEMWVRLISERQNFPLQASIGDAYQAVVDSSPGDLIQMLN